MKNQKYIIALIILSWLTIKARAQSIEQNYIHSLVPLVELQSIPSNPSIDIVMQSIEYKDGFGRSIQIVQKQRSPNQKDFVQPIKYDEFGRQKFEYQPYSSPTTDGTYKYDWDGTFTNPGELLYFYKDAANGIALTMHPWGEKEFDNSPLNRVTKQGFAGFSWQLSQHPKQFNFRTNNGEEKVWTFNHNGSYWLSDDYYSSGELFVSELFDENGNITREFKDKRDNVIMIESMLSSTTRARTYYVYDDFNNLSLVIPPIPASNLSSQAEVPNKDDYCYQYSYDNKHRMITKKLPGKTVEYMVYDNLDRLILTQDGNLRIDTNWLFNQYDILGRPIQSGIYSQDTFNISFDTINQYVSSKLEDSINFNYEIFEGASQSNISGYSNNIADYLPGIYDIHTINWYDNYSFIPDNIILDGYGQYVESDTSFDDDNYVYNSGRITGTATKILDNTNTYLYTILFYDKFGRVIQEISQNHLGGYDRISSKYDFTGNVILTLHEHNILESATIKEWYQYTYDHGNRLIQIEHKLGNASSAWIVMSVMEYNEIGELIIKKIHSDDEGKTFWQNIDYKYNTRGWLSNINRANIGNNSSISDIDPNLAAIQMVSDLNSDSTYYKIAEFEGGGGKYLKIELSEDGSSQGLQTIYLYEEKAEDTAYYNTLKSLSGNTFIINVDSIVVEENLSVLDVMIQVEDSAYVQLSQQSVSDENQLELITLQLQEYILKQEGIPYANEDGDDLFGLDIFYDVAIDDLNGQLQYNGNISSASWGVSGRSNIQSYGFQYDNLNRLTQAKYGEKNEKSWNVNLDYYTVEIPIYDLHGNITFISRQTPWTTGHATLDFMSYYYDGNKLKAVDDAETLPYKGDFNDFGQNSNSGSIQEYFYDANGNMTSDLNKDITVSYNHLNLPDTIEFPYNNGDNKIIYLYDANGTKLRKEVYKNGNLITDSPRDYIGDYVYNNTDGLELMIVPEGVIDVPANNQYQYFLKDHLGNTRVAFTRNTSSGEMDILQENHYYPFGMRFSGSYADNSNKYLYNGKELQDDGFNIQGSPEEDRWLDWYDYGIRMYDLALARFICLDPLADEFVHLSPYNYADNSPIANIDLWGLQAWYAAGGNLITQQFSDEPVAGPLSQSTIQEIGATEYGVIETTTDASFTNQEIQDFADWNATNGGSVPGHCLGTATRGIEQLTGVDASNLGFENASGNLDLAGKSVYDLGNNLESLGNATKLTTSQGQETTTIINSNTAGTDNTTYVAGPAGGYHSMIITRNTGNNRFSIYDQGTGWDVKNTTPKGAQSEINSINSIHPTWGSGIWQLNKIQRTEVRYPAIRK